MRQVFRTSAVVIALLLTFKSVPAVFAGETIARPVVPAMGYYFFVALEDPTPAASKGKAYYSGVFMADGHNLTPVRDAYVKFLQEKYGYAQDPTTLNSSVQMVGTQSMEEAQTVEQARIKPGKTLNPDGTFETGWTFTA